MWRSSTQSSNHAKQVLEAHKKALATGLKPTMPKGPMQVASRTSAGMAGNPFISGIQAAGATQGAAASNILNALNAQALEDLPPGQSKAAINNSNNPVAYGDHQEVDDFLNSITLVKYKERFIENGIEDLETILELNDEHLDAISVPLGHKLKILKRIKMIRQEKGMSVPESR